MPPLLTVVILAKPLLTSCRPPLLSVVLIAVPAPMMSWSPPLNTLVAIEVPPATMSSTLATMLVTLANPVETSVGVQGRVEGSAAGKDGLSLKGIAKDDRPLGGASRKNSLKGGRLNGCTAVEAVGGDEDRRRHSRPSCRPPCRRSRR